MLFAIMSLNEGTRQADLIKCHVKKAETVFIGLRPVTYLEKSTSQIVLNEDAAYTPDVAGMIPAQI